MDQTFYPNTPKIIKWVIKYSGGLIKNERQANYVLVGVVIVIIIIIFFMFFGLNNQSLREIEYNPDTGYEGKSLPDDFR